MSSLRARLRATPGRERATSFLDAQEELSHLDRGEGGLRPLVTERPACALDRLLQRVDRKHAEADRHSGIRHDPCESGRALSRNVVEVRRIAANDRAECDDGIVTAAIVER